MPQVTGSPKIQSHVFLLSLTLLSLYNYVRVHCIGVSIYREDVPGGQRCWSVTDSCRLLAISAWTHTRVL